MSIPSPVSMLTSGGGKGVAIVLAVLVVLAIAVAQTKLPEQPEHPKQN